MNPLIKKAILKADEIRSQLGLDIYEPINVFDACLRMGLNVRFLDINMEGIYYKDEGSKNSTIFLSNQRPLPRRFYTCGHELGHHVFEHGNKIDILVGNEAKGTKYDNDEFLVDCFAGSLLMPLAGVQAEFAKRKWAFEKATPIEFYTISSLFGTGYQTLIVHCNVNGLITDAKASSLSKFSPGKILKEIIPKGGKNSFFKIIDKHSKIPVIDLEVCNYIFLPKHTLIEGAHLIKYCETNLGTGYMATKPGIVRATNEYWKHCSFIRIQNQNYIGLAEYRHLETEIE